MKILIVEDERKLGLLLKQGLSEAAYGVTLAATCAAARDALCETSFDAIVLDLGLPDGDGLELLRQWRRSGFNEPVIILSARDAVQDRIKGLDFGAEDRKSTRLNSSHRCISYAVFCLKKKKTKKKNNNEQKQHTKIKKYR